jgi:hypothetical protein
MSKISDEIDIALTASQKEKNEVKVSTLRLLKSAIKNKEIEVGRVLLDDEVLAVISKSAKERRESIDAYEKAGRADLAEREKAELAILSKYLPEQMGEEEISKIVAEVIASLGSISQADTGRVIGTVMAKVAGRADGNLVSGLVRQRLAAI